MQGRRAEDRVAAELRELLAQLERSGLAERRADVRLLIANSRSLLHARRHALPCGPPEREAPSARKLAGKLGTLLWIVLDMLVLAGFLWGIRSILRPGELTPEIALALAGPIWILLRLPAAREGLHEVAARLIYHLAWGYDWFAEAFGRAAQRRLSARLAAREVMWAWSRHRRSLPHRPGLRDVEAFLDLAYGLHAAEAFRRGARPLDEAAGRRTGMRLAGLRWSVLIRLFGGIAASGAFWPERSAEAPLATAEPEMASPPPPAEPRTLPQRRIDLAELIRKKRQEITNAYGWKLKTEAEIAQRDSYLRQTRQELGDLERELAAEDA